MPMKFFIVDMMNLAFRSYYGFKELATTEGRPTGVCYGFLGAIERILAEHSPDYLIVAKECDGKTFRHDMYQGYKSNRSDKPFDLDPQIQDLYKLINLLGIPIVSAPTFEADDVIGSYAAKYASKDCHVYIASGDKDFFQLVGPNISILRFTNQGPKMIGIYEVMEKFGCAPNQVIDCLAIMGDASDTVPGVKGIGEVGAAKLIAAHGSLEGIYNNLQKLTPKMAQKLIVDKENAFLSKSLVSIVLNVPIELSLEECRLKGSPDVEALRAFCAELQFNSYF